MISSNQLCSAVPDIYLTSELVTGESMSIIPRRILLWSSCSLLDASCWFLMDFMRSGDPSISTNLPVKPSASSFLANSIATREPNEYPAITKSLRLLFLSSTCYNSKEKKKKTWMNTLWPIDDTRTEKTTGIIFHFIRFFESLHTGSYGRQTLFANICIFWRLLFSTLANQKRT